MCLSHHCKFSSVIVKQKRKGHPSHMNVIQKRSHRGLANSSRHARNVTECFGSLDVLLGHNLQMQSQNVIWINPSTAQRFNTKSVWFVHLLKCLVPAWGQRRFHSVSNLENIDESWNIWVESWNEYSHFYPSYLTAHGSQRMPTPTSPWAPHLELTGRIFIFSLLL